MSLNTSTCWIITEGLKGTENQCIGVAEALNIQPVIKQVALRQPWALLSPYLGFECAVTFKLRLEPPWPDLLITSGRKAVAASRYIKKASAGKTFTVHIQDPRVSPNNFDLLAVPLHDPARGNNVITTLGAPNRVTENKLDDAREKFSDLETVKTPRVAVLIGGSSKAYSFTQEAMTRLCGQLKQLDAGLMVTASRRTGENNLKILHDELKDTGTFIWDGSGENPYFGLLAWADYILVSEDSVSMVSDAATTGKPVYIIPLDGGGRRLNDFHKNMEKAGITRPFTGQLDRWRYTRLDDSQKIAEEIKTRLKG